LIHILILLFWPSSTPRFEESFLACSFLYFGEFARALQ
jgi:hypothetical protein